ncbi:MAG: cytochrome c [Acidobacteria bacterium]|nr:cytochrome c [Acidobacteriota bacterium]
MRRRLFARWILSGLALILVALVAGPWVFQIYWAHRSSNPVRRGVVRARELGCFSCHGNLGTAGLKDPGGDNLEVPAWNGGMSMMYVQNDSDIQRYILDGSIPKVASPDPSTASGTPPKAEVAMPAFRSALRGSDLADLTAAFKVLAAMVSPPSGSPEERGFNQARTWGCFSCHGPNGSGGLPNPGSFAGFIPGWYGPDFHDTVRDRSEFDAWVREGRIARFESNPVAARFTARQRIQMPAYRRFSPGDLDDLWAYARWLEETDGGTRAGRDAKP